MRSLKAAYLLKGRGLTLARVDSSSAAARTAGEGDLFDEAVLRVAAWGRANGSLTGLWVNRRHSSIGVGIDDGDEVETTEELRALVPPGIKIRTRIASARLAELWQLQGDLHAYLEDEHIWEQWGANLGVEESKDILKLGLLADTPEEVVQLIRERFLAHPVVVVTARRAIAL